MKRHFISYGVAITTPLVLLLASQFLGLKNDHTSVFLLFSTTPLISAWFSGALFGSIATIVSSISIFYLLGPGNILPFGLFVFNSLVFTYIIHALKYDQDAILKRQMQAQLDSLSQDFAKAQEEIKARDEFLSIASHELKTPLTSMLLQIQTTLHSVKNVSLANFSVASLLKMLESTQQQVNRLSKMISDLLNVSLITTKKLDLEKEKVDLTELTQGVMDSFTDKFAKDGYDVRLEYDKPVVGNWDRVRLEQVVTNLVTNAMKYGDKKPISVKVANGGANAKIMITDRGVGIPEEQQQKIFSLFERADTSRGQQGLGVGLFITSQIVNAHGGKIHLKSKVGNGSTFTVELPLTN